jgi:hypothetical protein
MSAIERLRGLTARMEQALSRGRRLPRCPGGVVAGGQAQRYGCRDERRFRQVDTEPGVCLNPRLSQFFCSRSITLMPADNRHCTVIQRSIIREWFASRGDSLHGDVGEVGATRIDRREPLGPHGAGDTALPRYKAGRQRAFTARRRPIRHTGHRAFQIRTELSGASVTIRSPSGLNTSSLA